MSDDAELEEVFKKLDHVFRQRGWLPSRIAVVLAQYLGKVVTKAAPLEAQVPHLDVAWRAMWATWAATTTRRYGQDRVLALVELFRAVESRDPGSATSFATGQVAEPRSANPIPRKT